MWPELLRIPGTPIRIFSFGTMMIVALWASLGLATWRAKREKLDPDLISDLAFWVIAFGLIGARLFYVVRYWGQDDLKTFWDVFTIWRGGIVLYGSILGGAVGFLIYGAMRPMPVLPVLDVIAPALAVGIAFGRLGCFLNGCCYGDRCDLPWAVSFPKKSIPWWDHVQHGWIGETAARSAAVHPTQIYSAIDGFVLVALLSAFYPLRKRDGQVMALLMVTYPITRFLIEILRGDDGAFVLGMTTSEAISAGIFAAGVAFWLWLARGPAVRFADIERPIPSPA